MSGLPLLERLREHGMQVTLRGRNSITIRGPVAVLTLQLEAQLKASKPKLLSALRHEELIDTMDLVPVDPETTLPALPADQPATSRQASRLRELAALPAFAGHNRAVREIVDRALRDGLSQLGAYGLLLDLGRRIVKKKGSAGGSS